MEKNESVSEIMSRLQKEYDFSGKTKKKIEGEEPAVELVLNDRRYARMTNGWGEIYEFWDGKYNDESFVEIETEADTAEEALRKLEELCKKYKAEKYIIVDPTNWS